MHGRARRTFFPIKNAERIARERELAKFDANRRASKAEKWAC